MARLRHGGLLALLVLVSATFGGLVERWIFARGVPPPSAETPPPAASATRESAPSMAMWICNRQIPSSKALAAMAPVLGANASPSPSPARATRQAPMVDWTGDRLVVDLTAEGYVAFVDFAPNVPMVARAWPREKMAGLAVFYNRAVLSYYAGYRGFDDFDTWSEAFGISLAAPILLFYDPQHPQDPQPTATWYAGQVPVITYGPTIRIQTASQGLRLAIHELAHVWDGAHSWTLSDGLAQVVQNPGNYPTARARDGGPLEDFAESVTAYLVEEYASNERWSDDDPRFYRRYGVQRDEVWVMDRHDYVARLFEGAAAIEVRAEADALRVSDVPPAEDAVVVPDRQP